MTKQFYSSLDLDPPIPLYLIPYYTKTKNNGRRASIEIEIRDTLIEQVVNYCNYLTQLLNESMLENRQMRLIIDQFVIRWSHEALLLTHSVSQLSTVSVNNTHYRKIQRRDFIEKNVK